MPKVRKHPSEPTRKRRLDVVQRLSERYYENLRAAENRRQLAVVAEAMKGWANSQSLG